MTQWSANLSSNHRLSPLCVRVPQVTMLRTCPNVTLTVEQGCTSTTLQCQRSNWSFLWLSSAEVIITIHYVSILDMQIMMSDFITDLFG